ncbi:hypothetical protein J6590_024831 [Homalodisca vitripennis]|nr:hypothetical protein J6590_024831 [Homalodisca vitripennis]
MGLVSADYSWPNALQTIRLTFFSSRAIRDIQSKLMYRQQRPSEPYADYLTDIGNSLKGPAFPRKTRPINPLAPALPKVKPLEIPISFSNIKSSAVIDTGSTRSIVAKRVFDALSNTLKGVLKKVEETSLTATAANGLIDDDIETQLNWFPGEADHVIGLVTTSSHHFWNTLSICTGQVSYTRNVFGTGGTVG